MYIMCSCVFFPNVYWYGFRIKIKIKKIGFTISIYVTLICIKNVTVWILKPGKNDSEDYWVYISNLLYSNTKQKHQQ